jgi:hypothetical protein
MGAIHHLPFVNKSALFVAKVNLQADLDAVADSVFGHSGGILPHAVTKRSKL